MVLGATLELTGTAREVRVGGAEGGAKNHTRRGSFYLSECCLINHHPLQHLLWLPEEKKKKIYAGLYQLVSSAPWCQALGLPAWGCLANIHPPTDAA